jgi:hypothetical protein
MANGPQGGRRDGRPGDARESARTLDLRFPDEATKLLLGYFVYNWFRKYLGVIFANLGRYFDIGLMAGIAEPTEAARYTMLFDFGAIHLENLVYVNGIYFYILSAHKCANHQLMNRYDGKYVLYLRGYDYEESVGTGDGGAVGISSSDTMSFTGILGELFAPDQHDVRMFKVLSPKDIWSETIGAQHYFYTNYSKMIPLARYPMCSVYLNAQRWQQGVVTLLDRMDH